MGYTLKIGEAVIEWDECGISVDAKSEKHDNAPAFGEPTDYENQRWPSYISWADFCRKLDIYDIMFNTNNGGWIEELELPPLIQKHPSHTPIDNKHLNYIVEKLNQYKEKYPNHIAQYPPVLDGFEDKGVIMTPEEHRSNDPKYDGVLCRAEWLVYWMKYAVENYEHPVFVNL